MKFIFFMYKFVFEICFLSLKKKCKLVKNRNMVNEIIPCGRGILVKQSVTVFCSTTHESHIHPTHSIHCIYNMRPRLSALI